LSRKQIKIDSETVRLTIETNPDRIPVIVFAPSLDWNVQLFQRPQQLALALARQGALVFYIQPKRDPQAPIVQEMLPGLFLCNISIHAFEVLEQPFVYLLTWNGGYACEFKSPRVIYDYVDDINVFYGNQEVIARNHVKMIQSADLVLVTARKLYDGIAPDRPDAVYCPNGVEYDHFAISRNGHRHSPPEDLLPIIEMGKPIIGYYGALARWFDYDLLKQVAGLRKSYSFVLIGPDYDGSIRTSGIEAIENIRWLGVKTYQELPAYLQYFDAAIIPFLLSDITHAVSPLKLFEYMAGGKPIVATPMRESAQYDDVLFAINPVDFSQQIDTALSLGRDPEYLSRIDRLAQGNTWDARALTILDEINARTTPENVKN